MSVFSHPLLRRPLIGLALSISAFSVQAASIDLAGNDGIGYLSVSGIKNWAGEPNTTDQSPFPYYFNESKGYWSTVVTTLQSSDSVYAEASGSDMKNIVSRDGFSTFSSGGISYDEALITGIGTETIAVSALNLSFNDAGYSPFGSPLNVGVGDGNYPWGVAITANNVSGSGLTFTNGVLSSIDLTANISVGLQWYSDPFGAWASTYDGTLSISGNHYAFDVDVQQANDSIFMGVFEDTRLVFNRSGTIAAVTSVPEPSSYALMSAGLMLIGGMAAKRRNKR